MSSPDDVRPAYDGSGVLLRMLGANGWGPLLNLGYFSIPRLPALARGLAPFQRDLVERSIALLAAQPGERIVDAGCGRGATTARIAESGAEVLGLDLLDEHVAMARAEFGSRPDVRFARCDVTSLPASVAGFDLGDGTVDGVHCLEAAFHFGPRGRREFLREAYRVLRPGGRLVLVDFAWRDDDPERIVALDAARVVRDTWRFEEFEPVARYRRGARDAGFREVAFHDWTVPVMDRFALVCRVTARLGLTRAGRALLRVPPFGVRLGTVPREDWQVVLDWLSASDPVRKSTRYVAFVFEKPGPSADRVELTVEERDRLVLPDAEPEVPAAQPTR